MWIESKGNAAFDNDTGIELEAQRCSKQGLKNMECVFLLWIFNVVDVSEAIDAAKRQRASAFSDFLPHGPSTNETKDMIGN